MSVIEKLLKGSIDMHFHAGPDPRVERRVDALQAALQCQEVGMRAIVLKSHEYPTAPLAYIVNQVAKNILVFGSITLDLEVGGLNTHAVEASAKLGARVVWMPTFTSANELAKKHITGEGITILDARGCLLPVVKEILEIIRSYRMILATGHLSKSEVFTLVAEARKMNIDKIIVTHPLAEDVGPSLNLDEQDRMAKEGAFIEHTMVMTTPLMGRMDPKMFAEAIHMVGAQRCILSTDFGQAFNPPSAEGMRIMIATMLKCGVTENEIEMMIKINPARLLGLDYPV